MSWALITGATSGIGRTFAERFAAMGYDIIITGRRAELLHEAAKDIAHQSGRRVEVIIADFAHPSQLDALQTHIAQLLSRTAHADDAEEHEIEILVNNAGYGRRTLFHADDCAAQLAMMQTHLDASVRLIHQVIPSMQRLKRGSIINVSSMLSLVPLPNAAMYCATKAFLTNFSETLAIELAPAIRVQALLPGLTTTDFHNRAADVGKPIQSSIFMRWSSTAQVVDYSLRQLKRGRVVAIPGRMNRFLASSMKYIPRRMLYRMLTRANRRYLNP